MAKEDLSLYICDVTAEIFSKSDDVTIISVYLAGVETNRILTTLTVKKEILPFPVDDDPKVLVSGEHIEQDDAQFAIPPAPSVMGVTYDEYTIENTKSTGYRECTDEQKEFLQEVERVLEDMDEDENYCPIEKVEVDGVKVEL